jgi:hypothetical protein
VIARPQDQIIGLGDDDQFFATFKVGHVYLSYSVRMYKTLSNFRPPEGVGVKQ